MYGYLGLCEAMLGYVGLHMAVYGYVRLCYYMASFMHLENNTEHLILVCFKVNEVALSCRLMMFFPLFKKGNAALLRCFSSEFRKV